MDPTLHRPTRIEVRGGTIEVVSGRGSPQKVTIGAEPKVVGRHAECALVLHDKLVSGMHLEVLATEHGLRVRDLGSRNGTFDGENRVEGLVLVTPATFRCGDCLLDVRPTKPERLHPSPRTRTSPVAASPPERAQRGLSRREPASKALGAHQSDAN
jgi:hypothetical protein